ncbi:glutamine--fructose-6-phosphate transaminase (isomerizing) [Pseudoroseicyclus tamaricis]|uniref:Glutamine--fructose-6-phosphate aminotransferase [isomerizing] n=1 Tax=Pseudoroseicyclus tamaricis TaxID=2705421 RepID=A0A6B2K4M8_9RHOB|nr:glutamine--fructose-6-phosphate transaminase (isomerizing) [Pseudoroseicyclus tamaricis]NDV01656.1 glutamine--fructose-6-phosphate transaminase (isomerizing) [Pseudoroseicyclus tamaricis]
MCGIVGVLGSHEVAPLILESLKRLEYRGYDSAGIATVSSGQLGRRRAVGKLVNLSDLLVHDPLAGHSGIGHTRWATHGAATEGNAHPHRAGRVAVVHNGIIENFRELREELSHKGLTPQTETDTETVAMFAESLLAEGMSPEEAVRATLSRLTGAYALLFLFDGEEDLMIAARKGSPLAIGHGDGEMFVGSDAIALAPMTERITYLEEGDWAVIRRGGAEIFDAAGRRANRPEKRIHAEMAEVSKAGHKHFMMKEIAEQPQVLAEALDHHAPGGEITFGGQQIDFSGIERVTMVACGTASYATHVARYWIEQLAGIPCEVDVASEYRYREPPVPKGTLAIFVSQSGETADTLAALRYASGKAETILSIVNVAESTIARESDIALPILAGREIGVASTKAFSCQLIVLALLALRAAEAKGRLSAEQVAERLAELRQMPGLFNHAMAKAGAAARIAGELAEARDILFLGRGRMYPLAMEGALKLKEISYIHAEAYASGELKHGPIALVDPAVPVIVMAPHDELFDKTVSNMQEVMARGGRVLLITDAAGARAAAEGCWRVLEMPDVAALWAPILYALPAQLLAYHTAAAKGTDVDQPRNLAKSVTVE